MSELPKRMANKWDKFKLELFIRKYRLKDKVRGFIWDKRWKLPWKIRMALGCELGEHPGDCGGKLVRCHNMTCYQHQPNAFVSCETHAKEYVEYWTEMWDDYNHGRL